MMKETVNRPLSVGILTDHLFDPETGNDVDLEPLRFEQFDLKRLKLCVNGAGNANE
ncbi:MAG: hypothetical protein IPJ30_05290 [Acidobacteria bacterium]|nr:hypothetical protein [Acidobacteriota bacterium]